MDHFLAHLEDIPHNSPFGVEVKGHALVLIRTGQGVFAYQGQCPHEEASLAEGTVEDDHLICSKHQWRFGIANGQKQGSPPACLHRFALTESEGGLYLTQEQLDEWESLGTTQTKMRQLKDLPGPKGLPLLGKATAVNPDTLHLELEAWANEYGDLYRLPLGPLGTFLVCSDATLSQEMLKRRPKGFRRFRPIEGVFKGLRAHGLFSAEGKEWRQQRKVGAKGLNQAHLNRFYPKMLRVTDRLKSRWMKAAEEGKVLALEEELMRFTVDVTTTLTMGIDMNTISGEGDILQDHLQYVMPAIQSRMVAPVPYWNWIKVGKDARLEKSLEIIETRIRECIVTVRQEMEQAPERYEQPSNFLEALLAEERTGNLDSEESMVGQIFTMLLAGEDTTANSIAWMAYYLAQHPRHWQRVQAEVDAVLGDEEHLAPEAILPFVEAVMQETMRLRPVAPLLHLTANEDQQVGDLFLKANSNVFILNRQPGLQAKHFSDPEKFMPDRWLAGQCPVHKPEVSTPFGAGPRYCPGRALALQEINVVMAMLARHFDLELVESPDETREILMLSMAPSRVAIRLKERKAVVAAE